MTTLVLDHVEQALTELVREEGKEPVCMAAEYKRVLSAHWLESVEALRQVDESAWKAMGFRSVWLLKGLIRKLQEPEKRVVAVTGLASSSVSALNQMLQQEHRDSGMHVKFVDEARGSPLSKEYKWVVIVDLPVRWVKVKKLSKDGTLRVAGPWTKNKKEAKELAAKQTLSILADEYT